MKAFKIKAVAVLIAVLTAVTALSLCFTGCSRPKIDSGDFLSAQGELIKNADGETVYLRGVNAGGLFVIEQWMNGFSKSSSEDSDIVCRDHLITTKVFIERFGVEDTKQLWAAYRENWWSDIDFKNCADMGMNVIRLPFTYMTVDFDAVLGYEYAGKNYDFSALDAFVKKAAEYGMYTILDLHGAYGSQNGQDHSGETMDNVKDVDFYTNDTYKSLTVKLWSEAADHFKDNPAVAGYDILNEPGEKGGSIGKYHWDFYDEVYKAIRAKDEKHIVIFESCWTGDNLPMPSQYGWKNCMYSFHHYTGNTTGYTSHCVSMNGRISEVTAKNFGVPLQMGEFTCYDDAGQWEYTLGALNRAGWNWNVWTYKLNNTWSNSHWGIVTVKTTEKDKVNAHTDSYETILEKFKLLKTTEKIDKSVFYDENEQPYRTLFDIMSEYCVNTEPMKLQGKGVFYDNGSGYPLVTGGGVVSFNVLKVGADGSDYTEITVTPHSGDGSVYLSADGKNLSLITANNANVLATTGLTTNSALFFPVKVADGYAFIAYQNCLYLAVGDDGIIRANGKSASDAAVFNIDLK